MSIGAKLGQHFSANTQLKNILGIQRRRGVKPPSLSPSGYANDYRLKIVRKLNNVKYSFKEWSAASSSLKLQTESYAGTGKCVTTTQKAWLLVTVTWCHCACPVAVSEPPPGEKGTQRQASSECLKSRAPSSIHKCSWNNTRWPYVYSLARQVA